MIWYVAPPPPGGRPWPEVGTLYEDASEPQCPICPPWRTCRPWGVCHGGYATPRAPWAGVDLSMFRIYAKRGMAPSCLVCGEWRITPYGGALGCACGLRGGPYVGGLDGGQTGA